MRALIVDLPQTGLSSESHELLHSIGWETTRVDGYAAALHTVRRNQPVPTGAQRQANAAASFDAMLVSAPPDETENSVRFAGKPTVSAGKPTASVEFDELISLAEDRRIPALVLTDHPDVPRSIRSSLVDQVERSIAPAELKGRLETIERYQPLFRRMDRQVTQMHNVTRQLNRHFREVDQEMRLAGRLQRDFLPNLDEPIGNIRFATVYRPALWVSGDTFDVFRVSENLTAVYVADAVGHGMAASLLTMFIRRAIVSKQISGDGYRVLTPSETVAGLNAALIDQELPDSRFVTACYMLIDHRSLKLTFAHGGHPYPIVLSQDGTMRELEATGPLLGIFEGAEFPMIEAQLRPGDKLLIYTDGMEMAFGDTVGQAGTSYLDVFRSLAALPIQDMMQQLEAKMDRVSGSLTPSDDVTIVGLECLRDSATQPS